jgi:hypothetical protein
VKEELGMEDSSKARLLSQNTDELNDSDDLSYQDVEEDSQKLGNSQTQEEYKDSVTQLEKEKQEHQQEQQEEREETDISKPKEEPILQENEEISESQENTDLMSLLEEINENLETISSHFEQVLGSFQQLHNDQSLQKTIKIYQDKFFNAEAPRYIDIVEIRKSAEKKRNELLHDTEIKQDYKKMNKSREAFDSKTQEKYEPLLIKKEIGGRSARLQEILNRYPDLAPTNVAKSRIQIPTKLSEEPEKYGDDDEFTSDEEKKIGENKYEVPPKEKSEEAALTSDRFWEKQPVAGFKKEYEMKQSYIPAYSKLNYSYKYKPAYNKKDNTGKRNQMNIEISGPYTGSASRKDKLTPDLTSYREKYSFQNYSPYSYHSRHNESYKSTQEPVWLTGTGTSTGTGSSGRLQKEKEEFSSKYFPSTTRSHATSHMDLYQKYPPFSSTFKHTYYDQ